MSNRMTKAEVRENRAAWNRAIAESRAVRFDGGQSARSFATPAAAQEALAQALADGRDANLIDPALAQPQPPAAEDKAGK